MQTLKDLLETFPSRGTRIVFIYRTGVRRFTTTYRGLYQDSLRMSAWLAQRGVEKGDRVVLWAPNSPWWAISFWGIIARGAVVVPVDFASEKERAGQIARESGAKLVIQSQYKIEKITGPHLLIENLEYLLPDVEPAQQPVQVEAADLAQLIYTSGTTGDPKGVRLTHGNLIANLGQINRHIPVITSQWRFLSLLPLSHTFEQMAGFFTPLSKGGTIVYIRTLKPSAIMDALGEESIWAIILVPRLLQALKSSIEREMEHKHLGSFFGWVLTKAAPLKKRARKKLFFLVHKKFGKHFSLLISGGAALDSDVWRFWDALGFTVLEGYGLTECSPVLTANTTEKQISGSAGKVLPGVKLEIRDNEILAKGDNVFSGYYQKEQATREVFTKDGWFKTGDLGYFDKDGNVYIKGRRKEMIVTGEGVNVFPDDVERVLNALDGVRESCVVGVPKTDGEHVHAALIISGIKTPKEVVAEANSKLDPLQQITEFSLWGELEFPKTTTLKIRKFQVRERVMQGVRSGTAGIRDKLVYLVSKVTGKSADGITDESTLVGDLGLGSIARLELVSLIEQEFRLDMEDTFITQRTTVGDLRTFIGKREKHASPSTLRLWTAKPWLGFVRRVTDVVPAVFFNWLLMPERRGLEHVQAMRNRMPVIFISNHVSYFDYPAIYCSLPASVRYRTATAVWEEFFFHDTRLFRRLWK
ncbi:MAG: AMP-binding protein, partial [Candidatus Sungbacteria bacterium]|nr:AMP-binding protein [Candidatus Sungbacteria bacterium]